MPAGRIRYISFWVAAVGLGALALGISSLLGHTTTQDKIAFARIALFCLAALCVACAVFERQLDRAVDTISGWLEARFSGKLSYRAIPAKSEIWLSSALFVVLGTITIYVLASGTSALWLVREDGVLEYMTTVFYLAAVVTLIPLILRAKGLPLFRMNAIVLAFLFFFVGMEEISWGQRIFSISTPEMLKGVNVQGELTLHNIWSISLTTYPALFVVTTLLCLIPFLNQYSPRYRRFFRAIQFPVTQLSVAKLFLFVTIAYFVIGFRLGTPTPLPISFYGVMPSADDEILEFFIAFMFFVSAFSHWRITGLGQTAADGKDAASDRSDDERTGARPAA